MSLKSSFLKSNDLSKCKEIYLLHLSRAHSDEAEFKKEIEQTPASVIVDNASNSDELERSKQELKSEFRDRIEQIKNEFFKK